MKYRVYDTAKEKYVTDDPCWFLKPEGTLGYNDYGDEQVFPIVLPNSHPAKQTRMVLKSLKAITA